MSCTGELCHLPPTHAWLVGAPSAECCDGRLRVAPGDANHSYFLDKVLGVRLCRGGLMPPDAPPLDAAVVGTLRRWICEGAPDN